MGNAHARRSSGRLPGLTCIVASVLLLGAQVGPAVATIVPPSVRALELPSDVATISADDPLLAPILAATSTIGSPVTHNLGGATLGTGKTLVTWTETATSQTLSKYIYLYPYGWQVLGWANNLRVFEHNGGRHVLHDRYGRVHVIYNDGVKVLYQLANRIDERLYWQPAVQVNDAGTPIGMSTYGTRGETFAMIYGAADNVILQCTWSSTWPSNRSVLSRRLTVDRAGGVTSGNIVFTGLTGSFQCIVADSTGRFHLGVELYSAILYAQSLDGVSWTGNVGWSASANNCTAYRFPNLVVDAQDRVHLLWQAEGYAGYSGSRVWWVGLYTTRDPQTGQWATPVNILAGVPGWGPPSSGQQVLFAYPNMLIDDQQNLHVAWHGTAFSYIFAWDDTFYLRRPFNPVSGTWGAWTDYAVLHRRDHFNTGAGEDQNFTWVPSLAYAPGRDDLYAVIMFGTGDDEVDDPSVNLTDGALKTRRGGQWLQPFENITQTPGLRSWYMNVAPDVLVDPNGRAWLDMIWVDGTKDDYNVVFRRIDLGGGLPGDCDGNGIVDVFDVILVVTAFGLDEFDPAFDRRGDLNFNGIVDVFDVIDVIVNFGQQR